MVKVGRPGLPEVERRRVWDLWKTGQSFTEISATVGAAPGSIFSILRPRGGIWFPEPTPPASALSLAEREDISRGLAAGNSIRMIAAQLGRAPSTISRETSRNQGPTRYRAIDAHDRATRNRARPQRLKLQKNPVLTNYVTARLQNIGHQNKSLVGCGWTTPTTRECTSATKQSIAPCICTRSARSCPIIFTGVCDALDLSGMAGITQPGVGGGHRSKMPDRSTTGRQRPRPEQC